MSVFMVGTEFNGILLYLIISMPLDMFSCYQAISLLNLNDVHASGYGTHGKFEFEAFFTMDISIHRRDGVGCPSLLKG